MIVVLAGGVGAARFLRGLMRVVEPSDVVVISNTGDDFRIYGTHVSPDLDIVCYTLAGIVDEQRGWGLRDDTFRVLEGMRALGLDAWFTLGDADFATCLARAAFVEAGGTPSSFARRLTEQHGVGCRIVPMTDDPVATRILLEDGRDIHFQEYWVRERAAGGVRAVRLEGAEAAAPAPGVLDAIASADAVLVAPSNPVVSIGTILAVPGIRDALRATRAPVAGVCPIVGGAPVRGMADKLMPALGVSVTCAGAVSLYEDFVDGFVVDLADAEHADAVAAAGSCAVEVAQTMMRTIEDSAALAKSTLAFAERLA